MMTEQYRTLSLPLFSMDALEKAFKWVSELRKDYSPNSDIWCLRRDWEAIKHCLLSELNDGIYQFSPLERYEFDDAIISLWSSQDMIALKLISSALAMEMSDHIPKSCYHTRGHGGLKQAVSQTHQAVSEQRYVMRGDIKGYYDSIRFDVLIGIIESYIQAPILLTLIHKALHRTETRGGNFYDYHDKGIPKGSPLSPLLGAIALIPIDKAIGQIQGAFYARFMDDWVVLTKSKTALRKVIKITHNVLNGLHLKLHHSKTYIGKISHGFNFLGYYMDDQKILPSKETIRRFLTRSSALYEPSLDNRKVSRRYKRNPQRRDISEYQVNEPAPTDLYFKHILTRLLAKAALKPDTLATLRRYVGQWTCWLKFGLSTITAFEECVQTLLPSIASCWIPGAKVFTLGSCL